VLLYEKLTASPEAELKALCKWWDIPYNANMSHFRSSFGNFWFQTEREKTIYSENPLGLFSTVKAINHIAPDIPSHDLVSNHEKECIERSVGMSYVQLWGEDAKKIRDEMFSREWFGFDLDDTLHEFRKASGAAVLTTLLAVATEYQIPIEKLKGRYVTVLKTKTAAAFTDGKTSDDYRKERFAAVLEGFLINPREAFLDKLAATYKSSLEIALEPKPGALSLLKYLKSIGKKIMIITEGPQDAQEWTIEKLGLWPEVDFLATTNTFGVLKVHGLFSKVFGQLDIQVVDVVYVGDNEERDIIPALAEGIFTVHYDEKGNLVLDADAMKVNTLSKLEHLLSGGSEP
jgi:FMN phosphatase YigB (HAD superfamily)